MVEGVGVHCPMSTEELEVVEVMWRLTVSAPHCWPLHRSNCSTHPEAAVLWSQQSILRLARLPTTHHLHHLHHLHHHYQPLEPVLVVQETGGRWVDCGCTTRYKKIIYFYNSQSQPTPGQSSSPDIPAVIISPPIFTLFVHLLASSIIMALMTP